MSAGSKPIPVEASMIIKQIHSLSLPEQTFKALLILNLRWPPPDNDLPPGTDLARGIYPPVSADWKPVFSPKVELSNAVGDIEVSEETISWAIMPNSDRPIEIDNKRALGLRRKFQVTLSETWELAAFPFAFQALTINLRFTWPHNIKKAYFSDARVLFDCHGFQVPEFHLWGNPPLQQEIVITAPADPPMSPRRDGGHSPRGGEGSGSINSSTGDGLTSPDGPAPADGGGRGGRGSRGVQQYSRWIVQILVKHDWRFYVQTVLSFLFVLSGLGFTSWAISREDIAGRLGIDFTAVLTAVAFKFTVGGMIPKLSYSTLLDSYIAGVFLLFALCTLAHTLVFMLPQDLHQDFDILSFWVLFILWVVAQIGFVAWGVIASKHSERTFRENNMNEAKQPTEMLRAACEKKAPLPDFPQEVQSIGLPPSSKKLA